MYSMSCLTCMICLKYIISLQGFLKKRYAKNEPDFNIVLIFIQYNKSIQSNTLTNMQ